MSDVRDLFGTKSNRSVPLWSPEYQIEPKATKSDLRLATPLLCCHLYGPIQRALFAAHTGQTLIATTSSNAKGRFFFIWVSIRYGPAISTLFDRLQIDALGPWLASRKSMK